MNFHRNAILRIKPESPVLRLVTYIFERCLSLRMILNCNNECWDYCSFDEWICFYENENLVWVQRQIIFCGFLLWILRRSYWFLQFLNSRNIEKWFWLKFCAMYGTDDIFVTAPFGIDVGGIKFKVRPSKLSTWYGQDQELKNVIRTTPWSNIVSAFSLWNHQQRRDGWKRIMY